jgi:hypothetical protein
MRAIVLTIPLIALFSLISVSILTGQTSESQLKLRIEADKISEQVRIEVLGLLPKEKTLPDSTIKEIRESFERLQKQLLKLEDSMNTDADRREAEKRRLLDAIALQYDYYSSATNERGGDHVEGARKAVETLPEKIASALRPHTIAIVATGDVNTVLTNKGGNSPIGTGSLGINYDTPNFEISALVALVSSADTVTEAFGSAILNGFTGVRSGYASYRHKMSGWNGGLFQEPSFYIFGSVASGNWRVDSSTSQATILCVDGGFANWIYRSQAAGNLIYLGFNIGFTSRFLLGDISHREEMLKAAIGTTKTSFWGVVGGFTIRFNHVTGQLSFPFFLNAWVPGLTGGQVVARLQFETNVFNFY